MDQKLYTLITGASLGIGRAFALECADRGMNLILVALPDSSLEDVKNLLLSKYTVDIKTFGIDLMQEGGVVALHEFCQKNAFRINMLINNAGMGTGGRFEKIPIGKYQNIIGLNNSVLMQMTHCFLPFLQCEEEGYILNMSSLEATLPMPYKAVYTASKSFVYAFSLALREELANQNIKVSVVCPGPVVTNIEGIKRLEAHGARGRWVAKSPAEVAALGIKNLLSGKRITIPGRLNWALVKLGKMMPTSLKMYLLERIFRVYRDL
jgi:uncharacterized protein